MEYCELNTGMRMPILGLGTYQLKGPVAIEIISAAIKAGYRLFDTAEMYHNEFEVGQVIKLSNVPREEFFLTTKLATSGYQSTKEQINRSLETLGLDDVDLMLIHWMIDDVEGTYRALEEAVDEGKIKAIGLSNFNQKTLENLLKTCRIKPAVLQNAMHIFQQQTEIREFCRKEGIQFEAWSPFGEGNVDIFHHPVMQSIANQYDKTVAQVILRFLTQEGVVVIPKTVHPDRLKENLDSLEFTLTDSDLQTIRQIDRKKGLFGWNES